jgi:hypothetical protein
MGGLSDSAALRDYNPKSFPDQPDLEHPGRTQCFQFGPADNQDLMWFMAGDANAQISVISGAWAIPLFHSNRNFGDIRREAAQLQKIEAEFLTVLRASWVKARVRTWTLAEFVENPMEPLQTIVDEISPRSLRRLTEAPRLADLTGFGQFLQNLRNQGMQPVLMGDFPADAGACPASYRPSPAPIWMIPCRNSRLSCCFAEMRTGLQLPRGEPERPARRFHSLGEVFNPHFIGKKDQARDARRGPCRLRDSDPRPLLRKLRAKRRGWPVSLLSRPRPPHPARPCCPMRPAPRSS